MYSQGLCLDVLHVPCNFSLFRGMINQRRVYEIHIQFRRLREQINAC